MILVGETQGTGKMNQQKAAISKLTALLYLLILVFYLSFIVNDHIDGGIVRFNS
jgi:hypothetical protein